MIIQLEMDDGHWVNGKIRGKNMDMVDLVNMASSMDITYRLYFPEDDYASMHYRTEDLRERTT